MHKCPKCGQEYEGNFCPGCGERWMEEKFCPKCGAKLSGSTRFCNNCGYAFYQQPAQPQPAPKKRKDIGGWVKSHLKVIIPISIVLVLLIILLSLIPTFIAMGTNGTYYKLKGGELDKKTYIKLSSGKWEDEDGETGTYKLDGEKIIIYVELMGETEEFAKGTVKDGVLKIENSVYISESHKHEYSKWEETRKSTCLITGIQTRTCECGVKETQELEKVPHNYGSWKTEISATCTEDGSQTRTCSVCRDTQTQTVKATGHIEGYVYNSLSHWKACTKCNLRLDSVSINHSINCTTCGYPFEYSLNSDNNSYTITGLTQSVSELMFPNNINKLPVTVIDNGAFMQNKSIKSIIIPDNVINIENWAFYECVSLENITFGSGLLNIGGSAFSCCSSLTSIVIPNSVKNIGTDAFYGCSSLKNVIIPDSVALIGFDTFEDCISLSSVKIGNSVKNIGDYAFKNCNSLTRIDFNGTKEQWKAILKGKWWNSNTGEYTVYCTDGTLSKAES